MCIRDSGICDPMPTAIVRYLSNSGFVITADGKTPLNETTQKIFEIKGTPAAYALYGTIGFGDGRPESEGPCPLHLGDEIEKLLKSGKVPIGDLVLCGEKLAEELHAIIVKAKAENRIVYPATGPSDPNGMLIAKIFLFGYSSGAPIEVYITFQHRQHILNDPKVIGFDPRRSNPCCWGSQDVCCLLYTSRCV